MEYRFMYELCIPISILKKGKYLSYLNQTGRKFMSINRIRKSTIFGISCIHRLLRTCTRKYRAFRERSGDEYPILNTTFRPASFDLTFDVVWRWIAGYYGLWVEERVEGKALLQVRWEVFARASPRALFPC